MLALEKKKFYPENSVHRLFLLKIFPLRRRAVT